MDVDGLDVVTRNESWLLIRDMKTNVRKSSRIEQL
jgi:hypothetical protein